MSDSITYQRTSAGQAALTSGDGSLAPRTRVVLSLIDGRTSLEGLSRTASGFQDLPAHLEILITRGLIAPLEGAAASSGPGAPVRAAPAGPAPGPAGGGFSAASRQRIEAELTEHLGPIAAFLCEEAFAAGGSREAVLEHLCQELDPRQRQQFLKAVIGLG